jgi:putative transposase
MPPVVYAFLSMLGVLFRNQLSLRAENVALRHQLAIYRRTVKWPISRPEDRILWSWLSRCWARWRDVLVFVQPATVIAWQRKRFRDHWARMSKAGKPGRPQISEEIRELIRTISSANPLWGTPRIVGELRTLGIEVAKSTVDQYRVRSRNAPSPTWKAFLKNHLNDLVSIDFLIVPTIRFKLLYVLIVLEHSRRKVLHFNVTASPTALWTAQQIVEAFPWDSAPKYLLRDRDAIYGGEFRKRIHARYLDYYHDWRTHLSLSMDAPNPRVVHPPDRGRVIVFRELGGLHHHYERLAT